MPSPWKILTIFLRVFFPIKRLGDLGLAHGCGPNKYRPMCYLLLSFSVKFNTDSLVRNAYPLPLN